jgi:hypothetical protein
MGGMINASTRWLESLKKRVLKEGQGVDGKMILVWISGGKRMGHGDMNRSCLGFDWSQ